MRLKEEIRAFIKTMNEQAAWLDKSTNGCSLEVWASLENARSRCFVAEAEALKALAILETKQCD